MNENNDAKRARAGLTVLLMLGASLAFVATATPVSAHECKSEDHGACDSHDCPDDGEVHSHRHNVHWWRDHGCASAPTCSTSEQLAITEEDACALPGGVDYENPLADVIPVDEIAPL